MKAWVPREWIFHRQWKKRSIHELIWFISSFLFLSATESKECRRRPKEAQIFFVDRLHILTTWSTHSELRRVVLITIGQNLDQKFKYSSIEVVGKAYRKIFRLDSNEMNKCMNSFWKSTSLNFDSNAPSTGFPLLTFFSSRLNLPRS